MTGARRTHSSPWAHASMKCAMSPWDMLELGASADRAHLEIGARAQGAGVSLLVVLGPKGALTAMGAAGAGMAEDRCRIAGSHEEAAAIVAENARSSDIILVKGSRGMQMEKVIALLGEEKS